MTLLENRGRRIKMINLLANKNHQIRKNRFYVILILYSE